MGKKNKKQTQKKRTAKALKRRTQKNEQRKVSNVLRQNRKTPGMPGVPGGVPPHMRSMAENLSRFAMPVFEVANPQSPGQMNALAVLVQSWWQAFESQDADERAQKLELTRAAYDAQPWAEQASFDTMSDLLLKRHIALMPESHTEEERAQFSPEDIEAAMRWSLVQPDSEDGEEDIEIAGADLLEVTTIAEETEEPEKTPVSERLELQQPIDIEAVLASLDGPAREQFESLSDDVRQHHEQADYLNPDDEMLNKLMAFQDQLVELFAAYLAVAGIAADTVRAVSQGLKPFPQDFLKTYHQASIFTADADHVEEYIMDFYLRKSQRSEASDRFLIDGFRKFYEFLPAIGVEVQVGDIPDRIEEIYPEYEEEVGA